MSSSVKITGYFHFTLSSPFNDVSVCSVYCSVHCSEKREVKCEMCSVCILFLFLLLLLKNLFFHSTKKTLHAISFFFVCCFGKRRISYFNVCVYICALNKLIHQTRLTMDGKFSSLLHECKRITHSMKVQVILYKFFYLFFCYLFFYVRRRQRES